MRRFRHHGGVADDMTEALAAAEAYRRSLLDLLGSDDPADVQSGTAARMRDLVERAGADLRTSPEAGEWSVVECLGHLVDSELTTSARVRWILAEDQPDIVAYDQALWVDRLRHRDDDPAELITLFETMRSANLRLWRSRPESDRTRFGLHRERGPESYEMMVRLAAGHDRLHLDQAERALATVRSRRQATVEPR